MQRYWPLALIACLVMAGCSPSAVFEPVMTPEPALPAEEEIESPEVLRLPINTTDTLNPYLLATQANRSAAALLYDGLYTLTPEYGAEPRIALSAAMEGNVWRVSLRSGALFSDGTPVTAQDVFYSFQMAYAEGSPYRAQLFQVQSCVVLDNAVLFNLSRPNTLFCNVLTFPIIKNGTGGMNTPVGSGRFKIESQDTGGMRLVPAQGPDACGPIKEVQLVALDDDATIASSLKIGVVDMMQTTQSTRDEFLSGVNSQSLDINALNYLSVGQGNSALSNAAVRRAIYLAINREELAQWSYGSKAQAAYTPFNPVVDWLPDAEFVGRDGLARAIAILEDAGFVAEGDAVRASENETLRFNLLVNSDNEMRLAAARRIGDQLSRAGIEITVAGKPYDAYIEDYNAGRYDLCLAEMQVGDDMNLESVYPGIGTFYGELSLSYANFLADTNNVDLFLADFLEENPFIPLVYRHGTVASSRNFNAYIVATKWDIFYNMADW